MKESAEFDCARLEETLDADRPEEFARLLVHSQVCLRCREEVMAWSELRRITGGLHKTWESPGLWPRIEEALAAADTPPHAGFEHGVIPMRRKNERAPFLLMRVAAVTLLAAALGGITWWTLSLPPETSAVDQWALEESALQNVEKAEQAHLKSIDQLQRIVEPRLENATTPLMLSYREKLMLLNSAIAECEEQVRMNRSNAQLRRELLSIYDEKRKTLQQLMREGRNSHGSAQIDIQ